MVSVVDDSFPRHRINVDEYYRMAEVGLLAPDARVELIDGEVFDVAPIGSRHASVVDALTRALSGTVGTQALVAVRRPVRLDVRSEPQPANRQYADISIHDGGTIEPGLLAGHGGLLGH